MDAEHASIDPALFFDLQTRNDQESAIRDVRLVLLRRLR